MGKLVRSANVETPVLVYGHPFTCTNPVAPPAGLARYVHPMAVLLLHNHAVGSFGLALLEAELLEEYVGGIEHDAGVAGQRSLQAHEAVQRAGVDLPAVLKRCGGDGAYKGRLRNAILGQVGANLASDGIARVIYGHGVLVLAGKLESRRVEGVWLGLGCFGLLRGRGGSADGVITFGGLALFRFGRRAILVSTQIDGWYASELRRLLMPWNRVNRYSYPWSKTNLCFGAGTGAGICIYHTKWLFPFGRHCVVQLDFGSSGMRT